MSLLAFLHIPRTGGHTVKRWLSERHVLRAECVGANLVCGHGHPRLRNVDLPAGCRTFSVVRNPWEWHLSFYGLIRAGRAGMLSLQGRIGQMTFSDYIRWLDEPARADDDRWCYPRWDLIDWLVDAKGQIIVDHVLRNERLVEDVQTLVNAYGLDVQIDPAVREEATKHDDYRDYYDDETRAVVARHHERTIEVFGYSF